MKLSDISIKVMTKLKANANFKRPASERSWEMRLGTRLDRKVHDKIWRTKAYFTTPRDRITWLKLKHRNLYTVKHDVNVSNKQCTACDEQENQLHLCECEVMWEEYWKPIVAVLTDCEMPEPEDRAAFLALGIVTQDEVVSGEKSGVIDIAWRVLYADIQKVRQEGGLLNLSRARQRLWSMIDSRLKAYGEKWKKWSRSRHHTSRQSFIPEKHQSKFLLETDPRGEYTIDQIVYREINKAKGETQQFGRRH